MQMEKIREMMEDPTTPASLIEAEFRMLWDDDRPDILVHAEMNDDGTWRVIEEEDDATSTSDASGDDESLSDEEIDPSLTTHEPVYVKVYYVNVVHDDGTNGYIWYYDDFDPKRIDYDDADKPQLALLELFEPFVGDIAGCDIHFESEHHRIVPYNPSLITCGCQEIIDRYKPHREASLKYRNEEDSLYNLHKDLCRWAEQTGNDALLKSLQNM